MSEGKYLFFDTETTGLSDFRAPYTDPKQPDCVQLAAVLTDDHGEEVFSFQTLVKPNGWTIGPEVFSIHGISTEECMRDGMPMDEVLGIFFGMMDNARFLVAHNLTFDELILKTAAHRVGVEWPNESLGRVCTMNTATQVCRLPGRYGYKWPNLQQAHTMLCGSAFEGAHDAMADVQACRRVFFALVKQRVIVV
jgi:DNA polymerase III subunit epsilon